MRSITIHSGRTLNSRQAANFVYNLSSLPFGVWITKDNRRINAKSILGVLSINIQSGDLIELSLDSENDSDIDKVVQELT